MSSYHYLQRLEEAVSKFVKQGKRAFVKLSTRYVSAKLELRNFINLS
jgi:hypothetical protein